MTCDDLADLFARAFPDPVGWSAGDFRDVPASPGAFLHTIPHAFALGRVAADEAELILIATDPAHRRTGLGTRCLEAFHTEAAKRGAATAFLEVAEANIAARLFYESAGYREVGRRPNYYRTAEGTALILRFELASHASQTRCTGNP